MTKSEGSWALALTPRARKQLAAAEKREREITDRAILALADSPRGGDAHQLQGSSILRKRAGGLAHIFQNILARAVGRRRFDRAAGLDDVLIGKARVLGRWG